MKEKLSINKEVENQDFNLLFNFKVKELDSQDSEIIKISGYGNYSGNTDDDSAVCIDRVGDVVIASGMDVLHYKKNPIILLNHDRDYPIGKAIKVTKKKDGLHIEAEIHAGAMDDEDFYAIKAGIYTSFSIGFRTREVQWKDISGRNVCFITKSELLECSVVTIPAAPESTFEVVKSLDGNGFYAGDFTQPTQQSAVINKSEEENTMKLKLKEMLPEAEVKRLEAMGALEALEAEQEVSIKQYVDAILGEKIEQLKAELVAELKQEVEAEVKEEVEVPAEEKQEAQEEEEVPAEEKQEAQEEEEVPAETLKALTDAVEKLKALV